MGERALNARRALGALLGAALLLVLAAPATAAIEVVATTTDLASLARAVGGDLVHVEAIVPAGADAEAFEPRPADLSRLKRAGLLVRVGLGYDYWLDAPLRQAGGAHVQRGAPGYVDASLGIPLLEVRGETVVGEGGHAHGVANPHYWLDPENAVIITAAIAEGLLRIAPTERARILDQRARFLAELRARREVWSTALAPYAGAKLVAYHNAWPYLARRFHLDFVAFVEPRAGVAPTPAHLASVVRAAREARVRAVVLETYEPPDSSRFVAQRLGVPLVPLALGVGALPGATDYLTLFDTDVAALAAALRASAP